MNPQEFPLEKKIPLEGIGNVVEKTRVNSNYFDKVYEIRTMLILGSII
jgi:hypothetical protein